MYKISDNYYISANKVAKMSILTELNGKERYFITLTDGTRHEILSKEMFDEIASASGTATYSDIVVTDKLTVGDIEDVEQEINDIRQLIATDVKDIVGTYDELLAYDTTSLKVGDIIEVLQDRTRDNANTMYRFLGEGQDYEYIGKLGSYYTKKEADERFALKADPETPEPSPSAPSENEDLFISVTQMQGDPPTPVSVKLTLEELRQRFVASTDNDEADFEDAEIGTFLYEAIPESEIPATWTNTNGRTAWEAQFADPNSTLNKYYIWSDDANKPYKEDLWNTVANRPANITDARKNEQGEYELDENGNYIYDNCERCWLGAINAPGASYPWAVVELPIPFEGTIRFNYKDEEPVYPWGEANRTFSRGFAIASIPDELNKPELKINAEGEAEIPLEDGDLIITLLPKLEEE